jgi:hypothetical protein
LFDRCASVRAYGRLPMGVRARNALQTRSISFTQFSEERQSELILTSVPASTLAC